MISKHGRRTRDRDVVGRIIYLNLGATTGTLQSLVFEALQSYWYSRLLLCAQNAHGMSTPQHAGKGKPNTSAVVCPRTCKILCGDLRPPPRSVLQHICTFTSRTTPTLSNCTGQAAAAGGGAAYRDKDR